MADVATMVSMMVMVRTNKKMRPKEPKTQEEPMHS